MKRLFTSITGQDGSYLADFLFEKGYEFHKLMRHGFSLNTEELITCM